ncbi:MAG: DUF664 domain-containing protein [Deltaproteobacteria bacterium]|nr:DUF664 domain-containing protein [Deltaproteobacteria bacterium]
MRLALCCAFRGPLPNEEIWTRLPPLLKTVKVTVEKAVSSQEGDVMDHPASMITDALDRARSFVHGAVKDLSPEELVAGPKPHIAWLAWHMARVQDHNISDLTGQEQVWIADGWHSRFGMPPEPRDYASGHRQTPELVDRFTVAEPQMLLDYLDTVFERTKAYLSSLDSQDLERTLNEPRYQPLPTVAIRLVSVVADNMRHAGQIEYLRGFIRHGGWFPSLASGNGDQTWHLGTEQKKDDTFSVLLRQAGIEPDQEDLKQFKPLLELYMERLKVLHEPDLHDEEIAPNFHPEWNLKV